MADCGNEERVMVCGLLVGISCPGDVEVLVITVLAGNDTDTKEGLPPKVPAFPLAWKALQ